MNCEKRSQKSCVSLRFPDDIRKCWGESMQVEVCSAAGQNEHNNKKIHNFTKLGKKNRNSPIAIRVIN